MSAAHGLWAPIARILTCDDSAVERFVQDFDFGSGISGDIEDVIEQAAEMSFSWIESLPE